MVLKRQDTVVPREEARATLEWEYKFNTKFKGAKIRRHFKDGSDATKFFVENFADNPEVLTAKISLKTYVLPNLGPMEWDPEKRKFGI